MWVLRLELFLYLISLSNGQRAPLNSTSLICCNHQSWSVFKTGRRVSVSVFKTGRRVSVSVFKTDRRVSVSVFKTDRRVSVSVFKTDRRVSVSVFKTDRRVSVSVFKTDRRATVYAPSSFAMTGYIWLTMVTISHCCIETW